MIHKPKAGMDAWAIVDIEGDKTPVPVRIEEVSGGIITVAWQVTEYCTERHEGLTDIDLYASEEEAYSHLYEERRDEDADKGSSAKRNGLLGRKNHG